MAASAAVLDAIARKLGQTARYLGPLFAAAALYTFRLSSDAVDGVRILLLRRRKRRSPERTLELEQREEHLWGAHAARWAAWRTLPATRRTAVRTAAAAAALVVLLVVRGRFPAAVQQVPPASATVDSSIQSPATGFGPAQATPALDLEAVASRFRRDVAQATSGQWVFVSEGPVLTPGSPGAWDDFTVASPWVLRNPSGAAGGYRMWYRGCSPRSGDPGCAIGHAASPDGVRWTKTAGPVFQPPDGDRRQLHSLAVAHKGGRYFLWYSWVPRLFGAHKASSLHLATSEDGLRWDAAGEVLTASERLPYPIEPSVLEDNGVFHLWFVDSLRHFEQNDFAETAGAPFLMHFTSTDGRQWKESGSSPLGATDVGRARVTVERRADAGFHASLFERLSGRWGWLTSVDGNNWDLDRSSLTRLDDVKASRGDTGGAVTGATGVGHDGGALLWFVARQQGGREEIRAGFRKDD